MLNMKSVCVIIVFLWSAVAHPQIIAVKKAATTLPVAAQHLDAFGGEIQDSFAPDKPKKKTAKKLDNLKIKLIPVPKKKVTKRSWKKKKKWTKKKNNKRKKIVKKSKKRSKNYAKKKSKASKKVAGKAKAQYKAKKKLARKKAKRAKFDRKPASVGPPVVVKTPKKARPSVRK